MSLTDYEIRRKNIDQNSSISEVHSLNSDRGVLKKMMIIIDHYYISLCFSLNLMSGHWCKHVSKLSIMGIIGIVEISVYAS